MNIKEFIEELKTNKDCNFIAFAITVHQANSIDATIAYLESKGVKVNGYVLMIPHSKTGRVVTNDKFVNGNPNIKYIDYVSSSINHSLFKKIISKFVITNKILFEINLKKKNFYILGTFIYYYWIYWLNNIFPDRNFKFILLEDGGASYAEQFNDKLNYVKRRFDNLHNLKYYFSFIKFCYSYYLSFLYEKLIIKKHNLIYTTIFLKKQISGKTKLIRNKCMSKFYRDVFKKFGSKIPYDNLKVFENCFLINTQPLNSNNVTDGIIDFETYRKTIEILKKFRFSVVIKPHPRELDYKKYEKLDCILFNDTSYTQESILANLKHQPKCVISISSSTLLNAKGIFNIPVISLARIIMKEKIDNLFYNSLKSFIDLYDNQFFFPESFEELHDYLKNLS